jgi:hypothetical protein
MHRLAPYIFISIILHAGLVLGLHGLWNWSAAVEEETELLVRVEVISVPSLMITAASSRLTVDPIDPVPLLNDPRPVIIMARTAPSNPIVLAPSDPASAEQTAVAPRPEIALPQSSTNNQMAAVIPAAKEIPGIPRITTGSSSELSTVPMVPREMEISGETVIPDEQRVDPDVSDAELIPAPGSSDPEVRLAADLQEAESTSRSPSILLLSRSTTAQAETLSTDRAISNLHPRPKAVSDEPRMILASIQLNSQPSGARVFIDDLPSGETPLDMKLPVGKHEFRLALPDHYDWKAQIDLTDRNIVYPIFPRLLPKE